MGVAEVKSPAAGFTGTLKKSYGHLDLAGHIHKEKLYPRCDLIQIHLKARVDCRLPILVRSPFSCQCNRFLDWPVREGQITAADVDVWPGNSCSSVRGRLS